MKEFAIGLAVGLFSVLVYMTYRNYKPKRKPPQDHYYADRKKQDQDPM